jgi:glycine hydroxymethyltransferase
MPIFGALDNTGGNMKDQIVELYIKDEIKRQNYDINLIASENYVSKDILEVMGSVLTNKYAEGYPQKRYYGGCENIDFLEQIAIDRVKTIFSAEYANVQPHSGSQANQAVYLAVLNPGDTVLAMSLNAGGHLTHGASVSLSGKWFNFIQYGLDDAGCINYQEVANLARQHKPKLIIAGASAYSLQIDFQKFRNIADEIGSYLMVDMAHYAGLIAAGCYPNPIPYSDFVTSTTHKTLRGPRGGLILAKEKYSRMINNAVFPGIQGGPLPQVIAAKAVAFHEALQPEFKEYQKQVCDNAVAISNYLKSRNFQIISGTTQSHMILIDVSNKKITGKQTQELLARAGITVNKNMIPNDPLPAHTTSGIRIGTPAITTRGFKIQESLIIAKHIADLIENHEKADDIIDSIIQINKKLCEKFLVY